MVYGLPSFGSPNITNASNHCPSLMVAFFWFFFFFLTYVVLRFIGLLLLYQLYVLFFHLFPPFFLVYQTPSTHTMTGTQWWAIEGREGCVLIVHKDWSLLPILPWWLGGTKRQQQSLFPLDFGLQCFQWKDSGKNSRDILCPALNTQEHSQLGGSQELLPHAFPTNSGTVSADFLSNLATVFIIYAWVEYRSSAKMQNKTISTLYCVAVPYGFGPFQMENS